MSDVLHCLVLHFDRILSQQEWRTLVNHIHTCPIQPKQLEARADLATPTEALPAIYTDALRKMYEEARADFFKRVNMNGLDDDTKHFVENLAAAIGEISPDEAMSALERFLAERK